MITINKNLLSVLACSFVLYCISSIPAYAQLQMPFTLADSNSRVHMKGNFVMASECADMAISLYYGQGLKTDQKKALELFKLAAEDGEPRACFFMSDYYDKKEDYVQAVRYLQAADGYYPEEIIKLAYYYARGRGIEQDFQEAHRLIDDMINHYEQQLSDDDKAKAYDSKGEFYLMEGKRDEARQMLEKAISLNPLIAEEGSVLYQELKTGPESVSLDKATEEARLAAEAKTAEEAKLTAEAKVIEETKTTTGETKQPAGTRSANDTGAEQAVNKTVVEEETLQNKDIGVAKQGLKIVYANSGRELQNVDFHIAEDFIQYKKARSYAKLGLGLMGAGGALIGVGVLSGKKESKMRNQWRNEEDKAYNSYINSITSSSNKYDSDYAKLVDECGFYRDGVLYIYTDKYDYFQSARQALLDDHAARDSRITMQYDSDVEAIKGRYENQCQTMNTVKIISYLGGTVSIITGAIFEIVGNVKISKVAKQQNNRQIVSLDFGAQPNGIGFALTF